MTTAARMAWSRGFDAGNYAAAYTLDPDHQTFGADGRNWQTIADELWDNREHTREMKTEEHFWRQGLLAGYYSSCEMHEVPEVDRQALWLARQMQQRMEARDGAGQEEDARP